MRVCVVFRGVLLMLLLKTLDDVVLDLLPLVAHRVLINVFECRVRRPSAALHDVLVRDAHRMQD